MTTDPVATLHPCAPTPHSARSATRALEHRPRRAGLAPWAGRRAAAGSPPAPPAHRRRTRPGPTAGTRSATPARRWGSVPPRAPARRHRVDRRHLAAAAGGAERLGPTYIKLGQIIASGDGVFPPELVAEFKWCRDQVTPEPWPVVEQVLTEELGGPLTSAFASVEHTPLAAASIAQVHAATLRDGTPVVVKVQRPVGVGAGAPGPRRHGLAGAPPGGPHPRRRAGQPARLVELFAETIVEELDFRLEAENMLDVAMTFAALDQRDFVVPRPHPTLVTCRMLVMERLDGFHFGDVEGMQAAGIDTEAVVRAGMIGFLEGALFYGIFHGDLHGGNLFVLPSGRPRCWTSASRAG